MKDVNRIEKADISIEKNKKEAKVLGNYPDDVRLGDPLAPWNQVEAEPRLCEDCCHCHSLGKVDGGAMMRAVQMPWRHTEGAIKAIAGIVHNCGICDVLHGIVTYDQDGINCGNWEEA